MASYFKRCVSRNRIARYWWACLFGLASSVTPAGAQSFWEDVKLVSIEKGGLSSLARSMRDGSGGLSDGSRYSYEGYYSTSLPELRFTMLSPITSELGIIWGFGTGESGDKYRIEPSFKIGFLLIAPLGKNEWMSLSVTAVLWGFLREKPCTANYGAIGGIQTVNCRMADSTMPPAETLNYLEDRAPEDQLSVSLRYQFMF